MTKIIAMMVGRNETDRYLERVLDRLTKQVDLVCFLDDASDDDTLEVAKLYDNVITDRMPEPTFTTNEYLLRETAWGMVDKQAKVGDWVLAIDCDEELYGLENAQSLLTRGRWDVIGITFYHMWNETQYRIDGAWKPVISSRLFKYFPHGVFRDRRLACGAEPTYVQDIIQRGRFCSDSPLKMKHLGYQSYEDQLAKYARYMEIDGGEFHSLKHLRSIIDPNPKLADWTE